MILQIPDSRKLAHWLIAIGTIVALVCTSGSVYAVQENVSEAVNLYYVVGRTASLYHDQDLTRRNKKLQFREPVRVIASERLVKKVRTMTGEEGYIRASEVSNIWILVSKRRKEVTLHRGMRILSTFTADFGYNSFSDKVIRGSNEDPDHWRTPEGVFYVVRKNPQSQFYKAFLLNYPNREDAERGVQDGLISQRQFNAIMRADRNGTAPPMETPLGGMIEIHGHGTDRASNWTQGCVAVHDKHMDHMWAYVRVGTPVVIEK